MSNSMKGKAQSKAHRQKNSESTKRMWEDPIKREELIEKAKNRPRLQCLHCGKKVTAPMFSRWHGDKCSSKGLDD
jgi:hypothetical protein